MLNKNRLLGAMASVGTNQTQLAKKLGMSKNTINSRINGKSFF